MSRWASLSIAIPLLAACGSSMGTGDAGFDAGTGDGGTAHCMSNAQCDDGLFCNGNEICDPTKPGDGCVEGIAPCPSGTCDEAMDMCSACAIDGDGDNDGYDSTTCGGDDCDDTVASVHPTAAETCDGVDNDCSGTIDDVPSASLPRWYADRDGDGYGAGEPVLACDRPGATFVSAGNDCDDDNAARSPGLTELPGDLIDNDCNGRVDDIGVRVTGGITSLGGVMTRTTRRVVDSRFERTGHACAGTLCVAGELSP